MLLGGALEVANILSSPTAESADAQRQSRRLQAEKKTKDEWAAVHQMQWEMQAALRNRTMVFLR